MLSLGLVAGTLDDEHLGTVAHVREALAFVIGPGEMRITNYHHVRAWFKAQAAGQEPGTVIPAA